MADDLMRRGLKLAHLRLLAALAERGQIGQAASALGLSQPAASRLLAEAEQIAGHPLRVRDGRGIALTAQGAALARRAGRVLIELSDARRELDEIGRGEAGEVRLGAVTGPALDRVLPGLRTARLALPALRVQVEVATSDLLAEAVLAGRLDLALSRLPADRDPALFDFVPLGPEHVSLVVRGDHRLLAAPALRPEDLMAHDWILPGPGAILRDTVLNRLAELKLPPPPGGISTSSFLLTLALIQQSDAIAPVARAVATQFATGPRPACAVLPIDLGLAVAPFGLLTRAGTALTPAAARIADLLLHPPAP